MKEGAITTFSSNIGLENCPAKSNNRQTDKPHAKPKLFQAPALSFSLAAP
jgi:hypothetical protein